MYVRTLIIMYAIHIVATQLCNILLENAPVDDVISVFRSHDLLIGDDLTVVTNAPSDYLKKVFLLRLFQNISLSVWSIICDVVRRSEILKHLSDQLVYGNNYCSCLHVVSFLTPVAIYTLFIRLV